MTRFLLLLLCLGGIGQVLAAETRYVTDMSQIMLRKGEGTHYKIVRSLMSGEAVEELSANRRTGYSRVRTKDGTTGYILTRQLQDEPGAREQLAAMKARLADLQQAPDQLAVKFTELQSEHTRLEGDMEALEREKEQLEEELAVIKYASANLMSITEERSELRKRVVDLIRQVDDLQQKNRDRESETHQRWFLIGAGVVTGAILIGLVVPHLGFRRKKPWGTI